MPRCDRRAIGSGERTGGGGGGEGSGLQRQKIMSSVAGDRGGTGSKQHFLLCVMQLTVD